MINLYAFSTAKTLESLTGLSRDELWNNGFNLDDISMGFQSNVRLTQSNCQWLLNAMENYCCGYTETLYNDKWYYLVYHA